MVKDSKSPFSLAPMTKDEEISIIKKLMEHDTYFRDEFRNQEEMICNNIRFDRPFLYNTGFVNATAVQELKDDVEKAWMEVTNQKNIINELLDYILLSYKEDAISKAYELLGEKAVITHKLAFGHDLTDDDKNFLLVSLQDNKE